MVDKLVKALETLKVLRVLASGEDNSLSKKEKMVTCVLVADLLIGVRSATVPNITSLLSHTVEALINMCDDKDSDVRTVADESLNRIIRSLTDSNMLKLQVDLHNEIKKNSPARCVRIALVKFSQLVHNVRPQKGHGHVQKLVPSMIEITKREEESVHETLAQTFGLIFKTLGVFTSDTEIKDLLHAFQRNLSSQSAVMRRSSSSCMINLVKRCRKQHVFVTFLLNMLLDSLIPVDPDCSPHLIQGTMTCLRMLIPCLGSSGAEEEGLGGSFGLRKKQDESLLSVDRLIQVYELCLHYASHADHNVVTSALETLNQLLQTPTDELTSILTSCTGILSSHINTKKSLNLSSSRGRTFSETSLCASTLDDDLLDEPETPWSILDKSEFQDELNTPDYKVKDKFTFGDDDTKLVDNPFQSGDKQYTPDVDSDVESTFCSLTVTTVSTVRMDDVGTTVDNMSPTHSRDELDSIADIITCQLNVGSFTDADVPLLYCSRYLASRFLLDGSCGGLKPDKIVRVSIKSLVLSCFSSIVRMCPSVVKLKLAANEADCPQNMSDVFLNYQHSDPQLRGVCCAVISSYISASVTESRSNYETWLRNSDPTLSLQRLMELMLQGLCDESSICSRQVLSCLTPLLSVLLACRHRRLCLPILEQLKKMVDNPYWLVKVKLLETVSELNYMTINDITESNQYQDEMIQHVLLKLLRDADLRVRTAAAEAFVRIVPNLYYSDWTVLKYCQSKSHNFDHYLTQDNNVIFKNLNLYPPFSMLQEQTDVGLEPALSRIVASLSRCLVVTDKVTMYGCLEALSLLSENYPPIMYIKIWSTDSSLLNYLISLLISSPDLLNLNVLTLTTKLVNNLFAGHVVDCLKPSQELLGQIGDSSRLWDMFNNKQSGQLCETLITHIMKIFNIYYHVLDDVPLHRPTLNATNLLQLNISSPIRRTGSRDTDDKPEEKKHKSSEGHLNNLWQFNLHYFKIYQLIKTAHNNYKISLEKSSSDGLLDLLEATITTISTMLEVATMKESGRITEELLCYLKTAVSVKSSQSIVCVIQLLKSLFSCNLSVNWEKLPDNKPAVTSYTLYSHVVQLPLQNVSEIVKRQNKLATGGVVKEGDSNIIRRNDWKSVMKSTDKNSLASYIKLFEPMVICAMKQYTIRGDVILQCHVLQLLCQLVRLRVNYCLLDADRIFISFVQKQFPLIEQGQTKNTDKLLPNIFKFLVHLSYEKHHSKPIMSIPTIISSCDGLMASGQSPVTHCIPALVPIVEDVYLSRGGSSSVDHDELETQKEVLLAMLLRLAEFDQVLDLLTLILTECKYVHEAQDKWKKLSCLIIESVLPLINTGRLRVETTHCRVSLHRLLNSVAPSALRPVDPLLKVVFSEPADLSGVTLERWLGGMTVVLLHLLHVKEDVLLNRLEDVYTMTGQDPANVFTRFVFDLLRQLGYNILQSRNSNNLQEILQLFLLCVIYIVESGKFHRITNTMEEYLANETSSLVSINETYLNMSDRYPVLTVLYNYLLTLLNGSLDMYMLITNTSQDCLSNKLVRQFAIINVLHYLCDNLGDVETLKHVLVTNITDVIQLSNETPIRELLGTINRKPAECNLLIQTISSRCNEFSKPNFVEKLLRCVELADVSQSGPLVFVLVKKFILLPHLSLVRLSTSIITRRLEFLLTLPPDKVKQQLDKDMFDCIVQFFQQNRLTRRHIRLTNLLNKLGHDVFDKQITDVPDHRIDSNFIKSVNVDKCWYFEQVRARCCQDTNPGPETALLLSRLSRDEILEIMSYKDFDLCLLEDCLKVGFRQYVCLRREKEVGGETTRLEERDESCDLYLASTECLLTLIDEMIKLIPTPHQVCRHNVQQQVDYYNKLTELTEDEGLCVTLWKISTSLTCYLHSVIVNKLESELKEDSMEGVVKFVILLLELINCMKTNNKHVCMKVVEQTVECVLQLVLSPHSLTILSNVDNISWYHSLIVNLSTLAGNKHSTNLEQDFQQLSKLLKQHSSCENLLHSKIRLIILTLCRTSHFCSNIVKIPETVGVQDVDTIQELVTNMSITGWSTRHQFEEMWTGLLTVFGFDQQFDNNDDLSYFLQMASIAVDGITTLLCKTLLHPQPGNTATSCYLHYSRDVNKLECYTKYIKQQTDILSYDKFGFLFSDLERNLECIDDENRYKIGQLSIEYIWSSLKIMGCNVSIQQQHSQLLADSGLDLDSCLHLLLDLYTQWIQQYRTDIRIITCCLKSCLILSDLFIDVSQYQWLLDFCFNIEDIISCMEDVSMLPQFVVACCKATAVCLPDMETCERVKKIMIRCNNIPARTAAIKGLLYLLQCPVVKMNRDTSDDVGVSNISVMFLPIALEIIQEFKTNRSKDNTEYEINCWSLIFYMLEYYSGTLSNNTCSELITWIINIIRYNSHSHSVVYLLIKGVERLVLCNKLSNVERDQVMKTALDRISNQTVDVSQSGVRLLMCLLYIENSKNVSKTGSGGGIDEAENMMKKMEVVNGLFERLRRAYRNEAQVLGNILTIVLSQLDPSEILTKVIQEFLSPQQPHLHIIATLLLKVFERAELSLLEDWVVFSLPSFVQGMSLAMSIWTLTVFFVISSCHQWLRDMFPLVRSRVRCCDVEDKILLCISARHFYQQLKKEKQREMFFKTFENAAKNHVLFQDLIQSLQ